MSDDDLYMYNLHLIITSLLTVSIKAITAARLRPWNH